jgi:hypothetical protein
VARIGGHESGLGPEQQVVRGADRAGPVCGGAAELAQQRTDGLGQERRAQPSAGQPELLDLVQQAVGLGHHAAAVDLRGGVGVEDLDKCAHVPERSGATPTP